MDFYGRRSFLQMAGVLGGAVAIGGSWDLAIAGSKGKFSDQISKVLESPDALQVRQQMVSLLTDPSITMLTQSLLENESESLSDFQQDALRALQIISENSDVVAAMNSPTPLTKAQQHALVSLTQIINKNKSVRSLLNAGAQLKHSRKIVSADIDEVIDNNTSVLPAFVTTGDPLNDAAIQSFLNVRESPEFLSFAATLTPFLESPDFPLFLREQQPQILTGFLPADFLSPLPLAPNPSEISIRPNAVLLIVLILLAAICILILIVVTIILKAPPDERGVAPYFHAITLAIFAAIAAVTRFFRHIFGS